MDTTELEIRIAHQDRTLEQLHEVILDLRRDLDALSRKVLELTARLESDNGEIGGANEPPPHW